jgi:hypothetical protein
MLPFDEKNNKKGNRQKILDKENPEMCRKKV